MFIIIHNILAWLLVEVDDDCSTWEMLDSNADINNVITCPPPPFSFCSNSIPVAEDSMSVVPAAIVLLLMTLRRDALLLLMEEWWNDDDGAAWCATLWWWCGGNDRQLLLLWECPRYEIPFFWMIDDVGIKKLAVDGEAVANANRRRMAWRTTSDNIMVGCS